MPLYVTEDFAAGIDTRKHPLTAPAGTLRQLKNGHVNPGGEIEKRLAFVEAFDAAGTLDKSLMRVGDVVYVVTSGAPPADEAYGNLTLRHLQASGVTGELLDWDVFDGLLYFTTLDGTTVSHWFQDTPGGTTASAVPDGLGAYVRTYQSKMYSCAGSTIYFSAVGDPTNWTDTAQGAGFINAATNDAEAVDLQGIEVYYDRLAFFSTRAIQIWNMDADPANNQQEQTIRSIGVAGRATPRQYGPGDVLFLAPNGVRSLQARDSSNAASVSDVGSPIDADLQEKIINDPDAVLATARTMLEDLTGRFWLMFSNEIWVLSLFPGPRVSAWSRYMPELPGGQTFTPVELTDAGGYVVVRSSDGKLYVLGGADRTTYDDTEIEVVTPHMALGRPIVYKMLKALDLALDGVWDVEVSYDPDQIVWEPVGQFAKSTYNDQSMGLQGMSTGLSLRFKCRSVSRARLATIGVFFELSRED